MEALTRAIAQSSRNVGMRKLGMLLVSGASTAMKAVPKAGGSQPQLESAAASIHAAKAPESPTIEAAPSSTVTPPMQNTSIGMLPPLSRRFLQPFCAPTQITPVRCFSTTALRLGDERDDFATTVSTYHPLTPADPNTINWDTLGFDLIPTNTITSMLSDSEGQFGEVCSDPYGLEVVHPMTDMYARRSFEGMKAARGENGEIFIIRTKEHYERLCQSAQNLGAPAPTYQQFLLALKQAVKENAAYVPPHGKGALYLRIDLGVATPSLGNFPNPGERWRFRVVVTPVGQYYKTQGHASLHAVNTERVVDTGTALNHLGIERPPGSGKLLANYGPGIPTSQAAKESGSADVLYTAKHPTNPENPTRYVGETSSSNLLVAFRDESGTTHIVRPKANGNLNSVTARGIMQLAEEMGAIVHEVPLPLAVLSKEPEAVQAFATELGASDLQIVAVHLTGTAAGGKTSIDTFLIDGTPHKFEYQEGNLLQEACTLYEEIRAKGPEAYPNKRHWFEFVVVLPKAY